jgi:hypothetical protein
MEKSAKFASLFLASRADPLVSHETRMKLWEMHTKPLNGATHKSGALDDYAKAYTNWGKIITKNRAHEDHGLPPVASLRGFLRLDPKLGFMDQFD